MSEPLTNKMDNVHAYNLGTTALKAGDRNRDDVGDLIDRGLILLELLQESGYVVMVAPKH